MVERVFIACMDLSIEAETSSLADMFRFYMEKGRMVVQGEKIPALEIVPWLQNQDSFELREEMRKEIGIFSRAILNPILLSILDILTRTVKEKFGFRGYADYVENKRNSSFEDWRNEFMKFLSDTDDQYFSKARPWVEGRLGRPLEDLNRSHALRLLRIDDFDKYFAKNSLMEFVHKTFIGLGLDLAGQKDIMIDIDDSPERPPTLFAYQLICLEKFMSCSNQLVAWWTWNRCCMKWGMLSFSGDSRPNPPLNIGDSVDRQRSTRLSPFCSCN